jgi:hypothetical protein
MKYLRGLLLGAAGLTSAAFFALSGASCGAPTIQCVVAHAQFVSYFAKYTLVSGDEACYGDILNAIGYPSLGEDLALSTYLQPTSDGKFADFDNRKIAIQSSVMGLIFLDREGAGTDENDHPYAIGIYTPKPDANNICYAGGAGGTAALEAADLGIEQFDTGEVDPMTMMPIILPAENYRQEWKNLRVYVTAGVTGTQFVGEMHFENRTPGAECTADYKFVAMYPSVPCSDEVHVDDDNNPDTPSENDDADVDNDDTPNLVPNSDHCLPDPDPDKGRVFGSGINPDFKTTCDPDLLHCVLTEAPLTGNP